MAGFKFYPYDANTVLPAVFAGIIGISLLIHGFQNFRYRYWRVTFFLFWGGAVFMAGWIMRAIAARNPANLNLHIAQTVLILAGPPIYAAAEYNILSRLMHYLPMHALLHPSRVIMLFIYIGAAVEALTAAGARNVSENAPGSSKYVKGGTLISISLVLQGVVECFFVSLVVWLHIRCKRSNMLTPNVRSVFIMLYGTATLILLRCIFRAAESFSKYKKGCDSLSCGTITSQEWYLYVFEAAPMVLYTFWLNLVHPGRYLPSKRTRYLDPDGMTERDGPGWIDTRPKWISFLDIFDIVGLSQGRPEDTKFWLRPNDYPACEDGSFALGTGSNCRRKKNQMAEVGQLKAEGVV
ncbi:MAG: hypothetical protein M1825_000686 [Sarcosagium campestre]|nr:MAG: hypothetical protein M1825_000686 [Sarcosagium campestre]